MSRRETDPAARRKLKEEASKIATELAACDDAERHLRERRQRLRDRQAAINVKLYSEAPRELRSLTPEDFGHSVKA